MTYGPVALRQMKELTKATEQWIERMTEIGNVAHTGYQNRLMTPAEWAAIKNILEVVALVKQDMEIK